MTSAVYENVMMSVDVEQVESAENDLEELLKRVKSIGKYSSIRLGLVGRQACCL